MKVATRKGSRNSMDSEKGITEPGSAIDHADPALIVECLGKQQVIGILEIDSGMMSVRGEIIDERLTDMLFHIVAVNLAGMSPALDPDQKRPIVDSIRIRQERVFETFFEGLDREIEDPVDGEQFRNGFEFVRLGFLLTPEFLE